MSLEKKKKQISISSGISSALRKVEHWSLLGTVILFIVVAYFLGDTVPILRTFKFWAIPSGALFLVAVILHLRINTLFDKNIKLPETQWTILTKGSLCSMHLCFASFLTAGWVVIFFAP